MESPQGKVRTVLARFFEVAALICGGLFVSVALFGHPVDLTSWGIPLRASDAIKPGIFLLVALLGRGATLLPGPQLGLVLGSTALGLGLGEVALRVLDHPLARSGSLPQVQVADAVTGAWNAPNLAGVSGYGHAVRTNAQGMREDPVLDKETEGETRILVVGDSFTFGMAVAVEDTFHQRLEALLRPTVPGIRVLNGGAVGFNLFQIERYVDANLERLDPDLVIYAHFWDDPRGPFSATAIEQTRAGLKAQAPRNAKLPKSYLVQFLKNVTRVLSLGRLRGYSGRSWVRSINDRVTGIKALPEALSVLEGKTPSDAYQQSFARLVARTRNSDTPLIVLSIPDAAQLKRPEWQAPQREMRDLTSAASIPFVDATSEFEERDSADSLYLFPVDAHTSPEGHRVMASLLLEPVRALLQQP